MAIGRIRCGVGAGVLALALGWAPAAAAADKTPIKIGVLGDMSGVYQATSGPGAVAAVKMAVQDFGGTVLGRPIEVVTGDHQNKPDLATTIARRWYDTEHVDMITDIVGSASSLAVIAVANERHKIAFAPNASASDINGVKCTPYSVQYNFDSYALSKALVNALLKQGDNTFFFVTADYAYGHNTQRDATAFITAGGGKVLGSVKHPVGATDFSSYILAAQNSGAKVIALANASSDTINSIKTANEFGVMKKQKLAGFLVFLSDVHALGLQAAQGLEFVDSFYWDENPEARAWSERFMKQVGVMPNDVHAADYSSVLTYLRAVKAAGTDNADAVMAMMRKLPINDVYTKNGHIRADGLMVHDLGLYQAKTPAESKAPWDYYKLVAKIPADQAFRPLSQSLCPLVKKG